MNTYTDPAIRLTMMPRDTNPHGTIFGGVILSYIDTAGAVEARRHTGHERFVTIAMREVVFHEPVFVGDLVSFYCKVTRVGTTSATVHVVVEAERHRGAGERVRVTEAEVVYVAVDEHQKKTAIKHERIETAQDELREKEQAPPVAGSGVEAAVGASKS